MNDEKPSTLELIMKEPLRARNWEPLGEMELHGIRHVKMRADLEYYRPAERVF